RDWSSDVCSSDLYRLAILVGGAYGRDRILQEREQAFAVELRPTSAMVDEHRTLAIEGWCAGGGVRDHPEQHQARIDRAIEVTQIIEQQVLDELSGELLRQLRPRVDQLDEHLR